MLKDNPDKHSMLYNEDCMIPKHGKEEMNFYNRCVRQTNQWGLIEIQSFMLKINRLFQKIC